MVCMKFHLFVINPTLIFVTSLLIIYFNLNFSKPKVSKSSIDEVRKAVIRQSNIADTLALSLFYSWSFFSFISFNLRHHVFYKSWYFEVNPDLFSWWLVGCTVFLFIVFLVKSRLTPDQLVGIILLIPCALLLTLSANLLIFFLVLEGVVYIFFFINTHQLAYSGSNKRVVLNSLLNNFILNFFSSIFLFSSLLYIYYYFGTLDFHCLGFVNSSVGSALLLISLIVKVSVGPWMLTSVEVYKGIQVHLLLLYSSYFTLVIIPKFFYIVTLIRTDILITSLVILTSCLVGVVVVVGRTSTVFSLKEFLTYSGVILMVYVLILVGL